MNNREIEALITQFPIYQYAFVETESIEFTEKVRTICKKECSRYGKSWSCPPAVGTLDDCKNRCREYPQALFFSTIADVPDYSDMDQLLATRREHEKITSQIEELLFRIAEPYLKAVGIVRIGSVSHSETVAGSQVLNDLIRSGVLFPFLEFIHSGIPIDVRQKTQQPGSADIEGKIPVFIEINMEIIADIVPVFPKDVQHLL